jgi:molybdopterin-guanine dinucleotide biosynthesis protein A
MPAFHTAGFVLAGGRSSRMGTDKSALLWDGTSLLARAVNVVHAATGSVIIVGHPAIRNTGSTPVIFDRIRGAGPLGGLHAALAWSSVPWNLIVACDMPLLDSKVLEAILERAHSQPECDAVIPVCDGAPQPLCAAYHRRALPAVEAALAAGTFKMMAAIEGLRISRIEMLSPAAFCNVNSPEDWNTLLSEKST